MYSIILPAAPHGFVVLSKSVRRSCRGSRYGKTGRWKKKVYTAVTENEALENLMAFKESWGKRYPSCVKSWEDSWDILSTFFAYPTEIRKIIYTTNIIEGLNRQFRQITKNKPSSSSCSRTARPPEPDFPLAFPGRETAFTLRAHTVSPLGTQVDKPS